MSINDNNEGYSPMKDIIAAQQIARRSGLSLLSTVLYPPVLQDNSFIADQHLQKREKKPHFEKTRGSNKDNGLSFTRSVPEHILQERYVPEYIRMERHVPERHIPERYVPELNKNEQSGQRRKSVFVAVADALYARKKLVTVVFLCLTAGGLAFVNYIPEPDPPPEDSLIQENPVRGVSVDLSNLGDEIPLDLTEVFAWQSYSVKYGDSVEGIARRFGLSLDAIIASNNLSNVRQLKAGQRIRIPNMDGIPYTVKSGDSYGGIASAQKVPLEAILDANDIQSEEIRAGTVLFIPGAKMDKTALRQALGTFFIWPLAGKRSSPFGWRDDPFTRARSFHAGQDISVPMGTPVKASADGKVSATGFNAVYGNFLIISHSDDYQTMYAHLNRILVKTGAYVSQGSVIARSGNSGRSTGPHLHFSVYKNKRAINPLDVVNK
ncbi:MAG: M23 family metallopeptidase [Spirochaetaceae bacterium]|jgi:murein DD-endopeptidase MepM/ murein hydrolase activator NlpD|nr:M23 family metallopeptidase [Spirochaetaceae bacterium]